MAQKRPPQISTLLELAAKQPLGGPLSQGFLSGIKPDLNRLRRQPPQRLIILEKEPALLGMLETQADKNKKEIAEGLGLMLAWPDKPGFTPPPPPAALTPVEQELFTKGKQLYTTACSGCHQTSGLGAEGVAPPLAESEWVLGSPDRIVRILQHGLSGPIRVNNRNFALEMPPMGAAFDDESIAAILTYIRREWGHTGSAVPTSQVTAVRGRISTRTAPWTESELLQPLGANNP
jgi:mono/diheme cytochrome c family protein